MKSYWKIILFFVLVIIVISGGLFYYMSRGLDSGSELPINNVNLSDLEDGTYTGTYQGGRWSNTVEVTIKDNKILDIKVTDDVMISQSEVLDKILNRVIDRQRVDVDVISEATVTSKAYLKAIERALSK